jgi:hypothetical protein
MYVIFLFEPIELRGLEEGLKAEKDTQNSFRLPFISMHRNIHCHGIKN